MPFVLFFLLISYFILPFETFSDGSDFSIASAYLGIPHPPSYPLFVILSRITYLMPFGSVAFRLNVFSAIITAALLFLIYRLYEGDKLEKVFLGLFLLFSTTFLSNAVTGEVYSLHLLFFAAIFFFSERIENKKFLYLSSFLFGLGLGNHHTLLFIGGYLIFQVIAKREIFCAKDFALSGFFVILGLSVYLYLPLRANLNLTWNWGNPSNFGLFLNSFLRRDFVPSGFLRDFEVFFAQLRTFNPAGEVGIINALFLAAGVIFLAVKDSARFLKLISAVFLYSYLIIILLGNDNTPLHEMKEVYSVFFLPAVFIMGFILIEFIKSFSHAKRRVVMLFLIAALVYNAKDLIFRLKSYEKNTFPHDYIRAELSMLPYNSVLILEGGERDFPVFYQQKVGFFRNDVKVIPLFSLGRRWNLRESLDAGTTYTKGYERESDEKKAILRGVVLFNKEFKNKRVFANILDKEKLPESIKWSLNGIFWEHPDGEPVPLDFIRLRSLKGAPDKSLEDIVYSNVLDNMEKGRVEAAGKNFEIFKVISDDKEAVKKLYDRLKE